MENFDFYLMPLFKDITEKEAKQWIFAYLEKLSDDYSIVSQQYTDFSTALVKISFGVPIKEVANINITEAEAERITSKGLRETTDRLQEKLEELAKQFYFLDFERKNVQDAYQFVYKQFKHLPQGEQLGLEF